MGIIDYFMGWKLVNEKSIPEEIIKQLKSGIDHEMYNKVKSAEKKAYKKSQGRKKPLPSVSGCTVYSETQKYLYRAIEPEWKWAEKDNVGRYSSTEKTMFYEKVKKKAKE